MVVIIHPCPKLLLGLANLFLAIVIYVYIYIFIYIYIWQRPGDIRSYVIANPLPLKQPWEINVLYKQNKAKPYVYITVHSGMIHWACIKEYLLPLGRYCIHSIGPPNKYRRPQGNTHISVSRSYVITLIQLDYTYYGRSDTHACR